MAKKKFDPKAKAKKQKVILAVGGVLLLALLAFQVPRTMKMMKGQNQSASSSTPSTTTATTAGSTPLAPPSLDGSSTAATSAPSGASTASTSADGVSDPSNPLPPNAGQLVSFSKFKGKDPFKQQIAQACVTDAVNGAQASCASASTTSTPTTTTKKKSAATSETGAKVTTGGAKPIVAKPQTATISINGTPTEVSVGSSFPSSSPVFKLVSLTASAAKVGIAGGTYESGAATVTLKKGKTVTLMNTADGTRYVLRLVATA
jgi:hypothetical protein